MCRSHSLSNVIKRGILFLVAAGGILAMIVQELDAQSFDHESYPKLDFNFTHLDLELGIQPQNLRIDAAATYQAEANVSGADTVILYAAHMDISSATVDGQETEFQLHNDSLFIPLTEPAERGQTYEIWIRYSTDPGFGLLKNNDGTVWTSFLPRSQRHWVPIVDNPRVTMKTTFNISVPAEYTVWATGRKSGEEAVTEEIIQYQFMSETEVPASDLAFAIGNFEHQSATYGIKRINLAVEENLTDNADIKQLLQQAYDWLGAVESEMQSEYPYDRLNIIVMKDHSWETKTWGGSTIFIYQNRGNLQHQLLRGIIGQWIGSKQRAAQWSQADAIVLYQTLLQQTLSKDIQKLEVSDQPQRSRQSIYDFFGPERWNSWQKKWSEWKNQSKDWMIGNTHPDMIRKLSPVISWRDYADLWYQQSGQPMFDVAEIIRQPDTSTTGQSDVDSVTYRVQYLLDDTGENVTLELKAAQGLYDELTTLRAHTVYDEGSEVDEVTFTGTSDAISIPVSPDIRTVKLEIPDGLNLEIKEHKPVPFLLYELRNAESLDQRVKAANNLGVHTENPDLQLAITDALEGSVEPEVRAALLTSLANITRGAAGTEQIFLDALGSDSRVVQRAGLIALENYPGNPDILNTVKKMTANADHMSIFKQGIAVLSGIAAKEDLEGFLTDIARQDTVGYRSVAAIQQLAEIGETGTLSEANRYVDENFEYGVRAMALNLLIKYDESAGSWLKKGQEILMESVDPRIRYLIVRGLLQNKNPEIVSFLEEYLADEYDNRVYREISAGLEE